MLKSGANVLLLDEPTNDLDVDTLRALEEALEDFAGCAVIISHDRWFLDRIATHILAFEGDSHVEWFEGNFQDYEAGQDAPAGHRLRPCRTGSSTRSSRASGESPRPRFRTSGDVPTRPDSPRCLSPRQLTTRVMQWPCEPSV